MSKMNEVAVFSFGEKKVEVIELNGQPLFNAKDVGAVLGMKDSAIGMATAKMSDKQVVKLTNSKTNIIGFRKLHNTGENFLTESGVYKLIMRSNKPDAEKFQDWIAEEVLPSIRKNGGYIQSSVDDTDEMIMARALLISQKTIEQRDAKILQLTTEKETIAEVLDTTKKQKSAEKQWKTKNDRLVNTTKKLIGVKRDKDINTTLESFVKTGKVVMDMCETNDITAVPTIIEAIANELDGYRSGVNAVPTPTEMPVRVRAYYWQTFCKELNMPAEDIYAHLKRLGLLNDANGKFVIPPAADGYIFWSNDIHPVLLISSEVFKFFDTKKDFSGYMSNNP